VEISSHSQCRKEDLLTLLTPLQKHCLDDFKIRMGHAAQTKVKTKKSGLAKFCDSE